LSADRIGADVRKIKLRNALRFAQAADGNVGCLTVPVRVPYEADYDSA
jgi:hypothetical protein